MTPTLLALSRAFGALPGAPKFDTDRATMPVTDGDDDGLRDYHGLLWVADPEHMPTSDPHDLGLVPDLTDAATGGVMLDRLGVAAWRVSRRHPYGSALPWCAGLYFSDRPHVAGVNPTVNCATLAEAVARVAVALGRAS